jgi:hemerythrin superfamily protein
MLTQFTHRVPVLFKSLMDRKLNATELLIQDHLKLEVLFLRMKVLNQLSLGIASRKAEFKKRRSSVFLELKKTLERHTAAEESVFYPECETHEETRALALESYEAHKQMKTLLKELTELSVDSEAFEAKLTLLMEDVAQHVQIEEEKIFPRIRKLFTPSHLMKMGGQLRSYRKQTRRTAAAA